MKKSYKERSEKISTNQKVTFKKAFIDQHAKYKHKHEFEYKGEMYDIISVKLVQNEVVFICVKDSDEKKLEEKSRKNNKDKKSNSKKTKKRVLNSQYSKVKIILDLHIITVFIQNIPLEFIEVIPIPSPPPELS